MKLTYNTPPSTRSFLKNLPKGLQGIFTESKFLTQTVMQLIFLQKVGTVESLELYILDGQAQLRVLIFLRSLAES